MCQVPLKIQLQISAKSQPPVLCAQFASTFLCFPNSLGSCQQKICATNPNGSNCRCCWEAGSPLQEEVGSWHNTAGHWQKQKQSKTCMHAANSPAMKGTYHSSLPCTWDWVRRSSYHRPDAEGVYGGCPPKERIGDQTIHPNRKTKWKQVEISISTLRWVRKNWGCYFSHSSGPSAPKLSHAT